MWTYHTRVRAVISKKIITCLYQDDLSDTYFRLFSTS